MGEMQADLGAIARNVTQKKWNWTGHIGKLQDGRWTVTHPVLSKKTRGRIEEDPQQQG